MLITVDMILIVFTLIIIYNIKELKDIKDKLYSKDNKKFFSKEIVDSMDAYCFAILYMDDGSLSSKKKK